MIVIKTKPWRDLNFQGFFERVFFWKDENDPLIEKLTEICMFGFNYKPQTFFRNNKNFITIEEFMNNIDYSRDKFTKIQKLLHKYNSINKHIDFVKIQEHDTWNLDELLSSIIGPSLLALKEEKQGYPLVDDIDVPEELQTKSENVEDNYSLSKWDYVLNEMIFAFTQDQWEFIEDSKEEEIKKQRIQNGYRLFGKYYSCLWT